MILQRIIGVLLPAEQCAEAPSVLHRFRFIKILLNISTIIIPVTLFSICQNPHFSGSFQMYHKQISLMRLVFHQLCLFSSHGMYYFLPWIMVSTLVWKKVKTEPEQGMPPIHRKPDVTSPRYEKNAAW